MRKLTLIFIFSILSIFSCGSYLLYKSYLCSYKSNFREYININKKNVSHSTIRITPSELYVNSNRIIWEDENKEVVYDGVLYDVFNIKCQNGQVVLTLISDTQEQEIKKQFAENFKENSSNQTHNSLKLLKQFLGLKYISNDDVLKINSSQILNEYQMGLALTLVSVFISTETLPPNRFV